MKNPGPTDIAITSVIILWSVLWRGVAMWRSVKEDQRNWFIVFLVINMIIFFTAGIPELLYLFLFAKRKLTLTEIRGWVPKVRSKKKNPTK